MENEELQSPHVQIFRVVPAEDADTAYSGVTERNSRWTSAGASVAYASRSAASAMLEFLAHLEGDTPEDLRLVVATLCCDLVRPVATLPEDWDQRPYRANVQSVGDEWLQSQSSLGLEVPSALCHRTANVLINTQHPEHGSLAILSQDVISIDPRLRF